MAHLFAGTQAGMRSCSGGSSRLTSKKPRKGSWISEISRLSESGSILTSSGLNRFQSQVLRDQLESFEEKEEKEAGATVRDLL